MTDACVDDHTFVGWGKTPRWNRDIVITEKIDGTNAVVLMDGDGKLVRVGSKNRWITPTKNGDNHRFAEYVWDNRYMFELLGPGHHFGEWWGQGIQRGYGLTENRFSLFNAHRWNIAGVPDGLFVVPTLYVGPISTNIDKITDMDMVRCCTDDLRDHGSIAASGYMNPEGLVVYNTASGHRYKVTLENDQYHKGENK